MIVYLWIKFQSSTPIFSKDIARKPKVLRTGRTDVRTDSGDTISPRPPIENGGGIKRNEENTTKALRVCLNIIAFVALLYAGKLRIFGPDSRAFYEFSKSFDQKTYLIVRQTDFNMPSAQ